MPPAFALAGERLWESFRSATAVSGCRRHAYCPYNRLRTLPEHCRQLYRTPWFWLKYNEFDRSSLMHDNPGGEKIGVSAYMSPV